MALPGEADEYTECVDCGQPLATEVLKSAAGYYIGSFCGNCGPHNRMSGYYQTRDQAETDLATYKEEGFLINGRY